MGNNLYADCLDYKDWVSLNNAQRCHENMYTQLPIFYTGVFVSALSFPQFTFWSSLVYLGLRINYTRAYFTNRGYNRAVALEEWLKLMLIVILCGAFASSFRISGLSTKLRALRGKKSK